MADDAAVSTAAVTAGILARSVIAPSALDSATRDELWAFVTTFTTRARDRFERALARADELLLYRDRDGALRAFAAVQTLSLPRAGEPVGILYTQFAMIDPAFRGRNVIHQAGMRAYVAYRRRHPLRPVYWAFGASTYTSYLLMTRNFVECWPHRSSPTPPAERALLGAIADALGEEQWDEQGGVIRRHGASRYFEGIAERDPDALADPDVRFYAERNPGQRDGDTVLCLAPLTLKSWAYIGARALRKALSGRGRRRLR